ncbi:hypothetical protein RF11_13404 [Thelohanellus kitauei]|uniref:FYVE-type domain-containing protein n=1 Tax=Thelohanellus kitauei TaxID=669202 RepID=A0A0C2NDG7_THEKT|nr:hypothetical protein RF11_13404 [Thelohanellus kitauei]
MSCAVGKIIRFKSMFSKHGSDRCWVVGTPFKSYILTSNDVIEKQHWVNILTEASRRVADRLGCQFEVNPAATWVPDSDAKHCMCCNKHHCRKCGKVVCGSCSKRKAIIDQNVKTPVRICDECHYAMEKETFLGL